LEIAGVVHVEYHRVVGVNRRVVGIGRTMNGLRRLLGDVITVLGEAIVDVAGQVERFTLQAVVVVVVVVDIDVLSVKSRRPVPPF
jgi:hypothetical protein